MKTLPDEIVGAFPDLMRAYPDGPIAAQVAAFVAADVPNTRAALDALERDGRAKIVRRGRGLHLVPADYPGLICPVCRAEYERAKKSKRRTCSRTCAISWSWTRPGVAERRKAGIKAQRQSPEVKANTAERNRRRWSDPAQRARLSEWNKKRWADPYTKAEMSVAIQRAQLTPERREFQANQIKSRWDDAEGREKLISGMRASHQTEEYKRNFSEALQRRWKRDRDKMLATSIANAKKATAAVKGRKQSAEHIRKRVESTKRAKA